MPSPPSASDFNLAVLAVLSYRAISFWLPTLPGADRLLPAAPHGGSLAERAGGSLGARERRAIETAGPLHAC